MSTPEQQEPQNPTAEEVEGVLVLLLAGASVGATAAAISKFLKIPLKSLVAVLLMVSVGPKPPFAVSKSHPQAGPGVQKHTSPTQITADANNLYRAAFLVNSSRRVSAANEPKKQMEREQQFWQMHVSASNRRMIMAKDAEVAAEEHGKLLGWYTTIDARTDDACRAANRRNFDVSNPPVIGWPGSVHGFCRCKVGPPFPGAKLVDQSSIVRMSPDASGFEKRSGNA